MKKRIYFTITLTLLLTNGICQSINSDKLKLHFYQQEYFINVLRIPAVKYDAKKKEERINHISEGKEEIVKKLVFLKMSKSDVRHVNSADYRNAPRDDRQWDYPAYRRVLTIDKDIADYYLKADAYYPVFEKEIEYSFYMDETMFPKNYKFYGDISQTMKEEIVFSSYLTNWHNLFSEKLFRHYVFRDRIVYVNDSTKNDKTFYNGFSYTIANDTLIVDLNTRYINLSKHQELIEEEKGYKSALSFPLHNLAIEEGLSKEDMFENLMLNQGLKYFSDKEFHKSRQFFRNEYAVDNTKVRELFLAGLSDYYTGYRNRGKKAILKSYNLGYLPAKEWLEDTDKKKKKRENK